MTTYSSAVINYDPQPAGCVLVQKSVQISRFSPHDVGPAREFATLDEARAWVKAQGNMGPDGRPRLTFRNPYDTSHEVWSHAHYGGNVLIGTVLYHVIS